MKSSILGGIRLDNGKVGAAFFSQGQAFGPVFDSTEDAANFMLFLGGTDPVQFMDWAEHSLAHELLVAWNACGRLPQRPVVQLDSSWLVKRDITGWMMADNLARCCFPLFNGFDNNQIGDVLTERGVVGDAELDSESSCFFAYFKTKKQGLAFIARLNDFLRRNWHLAYSEPNTAA